MSTKTFDDFLAESDQTIADGEEGVGISFTQDDIPKVSPKRGRPRKNKAPDPVWETPPAPKPQPPASVKSIGAPGALETPKKKLLSIIRSWKSSPVFQERFSHIEVDDRMSLVELTAIHQEMKCIIGRDFSRNIVDGFFKQSLSLTESFMVKYMEWEHASGFTEDILKDKDEFQDELEELSLQLSNNVNIGPLPRLIGKVTLKGMKVINDKIDGLKERRVNINI